MEDPQTKRISDEAHDLAADIMEGKLDGRDDDVTVGAIVVLVGAMTTYGNISLQEFVAGVEAYRLGLGGMDEERDFEN